MTDSDLSEVIAQYGAASAIDDFESMEALRHPDWQEAWPQSGETVIGNANYRAVRLGRPEGAPRVTPLRHGGAGQVWWGEAAVDYADGSRSLAITIYELEDGLIRRERVYFGTSHPAPDWRRPWVEVGPTALD